MLLPHPPWGSNQESIRNSLVSPAPPHHTCQLLLCMLPPLPLWWMNYPYSHQRMPLHCTPGPSPLTSLHAMALDIANHSHVLETFFIFGFHDTTWTYFPPMPLPTLLLSLHGWLLSSLLCFISTGPQGDISQFCGFASHFWQILTLAWPPSQRPNWCIQLPSVHLHLYSI